MSVFDIFKKQEQRLLLMAALPPAYLLVANR